MYIELHQGAKRGNSKRRVEKARGQKNGAQGKNACRYLPAAARAGKCPTSERWQRMACEWSSPVHGAAEGRAHLQNRENSTGKRGSKKRRKVESGPQASAKRTIPPASPTQSSHLVNGEGILRHVHESSASSPSSSSRSMAPTRTFAMFPLLSTNTEVGNALTPMYLASEQRVSM